MLPAQLKYMQGKTAVVVYQIQLGLPIWNICMYELKSFQGNFFWMRSMRRESAFRHAVEYGVYVVPVPFSGDEVIFFAPHSF